MARPKKTTKKEMPQGLSRFAPSTASTEFEGEEVESALTFAFWKPREGDRRTFEMLGFEKKVSKEFEEREFLVYFCRDLKTGEDFSFVPGGLFDHIIREKNIVNGDRLGVVFKGQVDLAGTNQRANQWDIVKLKKPATVR
jgi:hypothetical protein